MLVFGLLFALVLGWFSWQTRQAERIFLDDASEHARLLADAVILHARGAVTAEAVTAAMLTRFLSNAAGFVAYLDGIAPFTADELAAFAGEADLSVIRIVGRDGVVQGPALPLPASAAGCSRLQRLVRLDALHTILYGIPAERDVGCVLVGMDSRATEALEAAVGLPRALAAIADLPGVESVRLEGDPRSLVLGPDTGVAMPLVGIRRLADGRMVAQARADVAGARLLLDLDAGPLQAMRARLWLEFLGFVLVLLLAGSVGTWILYRHQRAHEHQLLDFERRLSRRREEAGLGRAAAAIAHEIRNPLNTMAMGLQRLKLEASDIDTEHRRLIDLMLEGVQRTNASVTGLLDYARPLQPRRDSVALEDLITEQLTLYRGRLEQANTRARLDLHPPIRVRGDAGLLRRLLDNLLHNALEALEAEAPGGYFRIEARRQRGTAVLRIANDGFVGDPVGVERLLEPWFTTKNDGTGLGLAICRRIALAHDGTLELQAPRPGRLCVSVVLPAAEPQTGH
ncbi:MAG: GHKL domain-containing protein [Thiohalocapsa sp.]|nr:GHKL domain-containing protein [Thiohalocapsa sp.]